MIKVKKLDLLLEEEIMISATMRDGMVLPVFCAFIDAEYDRLYLEYPLNKMQYAQYFYEGRDIDVHLTTSNGEVNYKAKVIYEPEDGLIVVEYYKSNVYEQRRNFVRVKTTKFLDIFAGDKTVSATTLDLSASGCKFMTVEKFTSGDILSANLILYSATEPLEVNLKILETRYNTIKSVYEATCEFLEMKETDRKKIIKFCYDKQTGLINKNDDIKN